jgi:hypothetical protein
LAEYILKYKPRSKTFVFYIKLWFFLSDDIKYK